jgi:nitrile hydratase subunit beta
MGGMHDLGGLSGFEPAVLDADESPFHEPWERLTCGLTMGFMAGGRTTEAGLRDVIERILPATYLSATYWERWAIGVAALVVEQDLASAEELAERAGGPWPVPVRDPTGPVLPVASAPLPPAVPRFAPGSRVRVRHWIPEGHTRCPRYVQGHRGEVVRRDGTHSLPDLVVATGQHRPEATYCVRFASEELWGEAGRPGDSIYVDLWDSYLEEAT